MCCAAEFVVYGTAGSGAKNGLLATNLIKKHNHDGAPLTIKFRRFSAAPVRESSEEGDLFGVFDSPQTSSAPAKPPSAVKAAFSSEKSAALTVRHFSDWLLVREERAEFALKYFPLQILQDLLATSGLGTFRVKMHEHGVDSVEQLRACAGDDAFLREAVGMKPDHVLRTRKLLKEYQEPAEPAADATGTYSLYEAPDGFRGTWDEVVAHEKKLGITSGDENQVASGNTLQLYESDDGLFRGTYAECVAYEAKLSAVDGKYHDVGLASEVSLDEGLFQAP